MRGIGKRPRKRFRSIQARSFGAIAESERDDLVMFLKRPGGQAQFSTVLSLQGAEDRSGALDN